MEEVSETRAIPSPDSLANQLTRLLKLTEERKKTESEMNKIDCLIEKATNELYEDLRHYSDVLPKLKTL